MNTKSLFVAAFATFGWACQGGSGGSLQTFQDSASYAIGIDISNSLQRMGVDTSLNLDVMIQALRDNRAGNPAFTDAQLSSILSEFSQRAQVAAAEAAQAAAARNAEEGAAFLAENSQKPGVTTTTTGLQYEVLQEGSGAKPGPTDRVTIHYVGTLTDGTTFDSSRDRGEPATFPVNGVIPGFSEGLQLMSPGSRYRLVIPGNIGYGPQGSGAMIGPDATLIFEVEMLEIL